MKVFAALVLSLAALALQTWLFQLFFNMVADNFGWRHISLLVSFVILGLLGTIGYQLRGGSSK